MLYAMRFLPPVGEDTADLLAFMPSFCYNTTTEEQRKDIL
jgi:hypothetical protein